MKKKYLLIPLSIVLLAVVAVLGFVQMKNIDLETGRIVSADNGSYLYVTDSGSVIRMTDMSRSQKMFSGLQTGDKVLIAHGFVNESYPGNTAAYCCLKLKSGDEGQISEDVMMRLRELGWIGKRDALSIGDDAVAVEAFDDNTSICVKIPSNWKEEKNGEQSPNSAKSYSVVISPNDGEGSVVLTCYPTGGFGVCGTGLNCESILNGEGWVGYYDNNPLWNYILINKGETQFVAIQEGLSAENAAIARSFVENGIYQSTNT